MLVELNEREVQVLELLRDRLGAGHTVRTALTLSVAWTAQAAAEAGVENVGNQHVGVVMLTRTECALLDALAVQLGTTDRRAALATTIDIAAARLIRGRDRSAN